MTSILHLNALYHITSINTKSCSTICSYGVIMYFVFVYHISEVALKCELQYDHTC